MIETDEAIRTARSLLGTPYAQMDCIALIVRIIRTAKGGRPGYRTAGTNSLWKSAEMSAKYRDLTRRQEGIAGARPGMLAFKRRGADVHHVGLVAGGGDAGSPDGSGLTVIHSSSARGEVVETALDSSWALLAVHRDIAVQEDTAGSRESAPVTADGGEAAHGEESVRTTIIDDEGNRFEPVGGWRVIFGSID